MVLCNQPNFVTTPQDCSSSMPQVEDLGFVKKFINSIYVKACIDPLLICWYQVMNLKAIVRMCYIMESILKLQLMYFQYIGNKIVVAMPTNMVLLCLQLLVLWKTINKSHWNNWSSISICDGNCINFMFLFGLMCPYKDLEYKCKMEVVTWKEWKGYSWSKKGKKFIKFCCVPIGEWKYWNEWKRNKIKGEMSGFYILVSLKGFC